VRDERHACHRQDGEHAPLWETGAILGHLCNSHAPAAFWPHDPQAGAQVDKWAEWANDGLTLADIQFGHVLYRYYDIAIDRAEHPAIRRYYQRLTTRPAFREHVMVSYEALRVN
jgi:glutathione S-transferase